MTTRDKDSSDASDPERAAGSRVPPQAFVPDEVIEANIARVLRNTPERGEGSGGWVVSVRYLVKALAAARAGSRVPSPPARPYQDICRTPFECFGHNEFCGMWVEGPTSITLDRSRVCTCGGQESDPDGPELALRAAVVAAQEPDK